jgi:hypothetical protein
MSRDRTRQWTLHEAVSAFDARCVSNGLKWSTIRKYRNSLAQLRQFCDSLELIDLQEITIETLDAL